mgnify:CR=1 FL=1
MAAGCCRSVGNISETENLCFFILWQIVASAPFAKEHFFSQSEGTREPDLKKKTGPKQPFPPITATSDTTLTQWDAAAWKQMCFALMGETADVTGD